VLGLILRRTLLHDRARTWRVIFAVALGAAVTTSVLGVAIGIGDQTQREFTSYGANIEITGAGAARRSVNLGGIRYALADDAPTIPVDRLGSLKTIFWRNNIVGFAPILTSTMQMKGQPVKIVGAWFSENVAIPGGGHLVTGIRSVEPWWKVSGAWPADADSNSCLVGSDLAQQSGIGIGDRISIRAPSGAHMLRVTGIVQTGGAEEGEVIAPLPAVAKWLGIPDRAQRVEVSAIVKPDDALAHKDPAHLSDADLERLECSPYISQITSQIQSVLPGTRARPVYRVADTAGRMLQRIQLLMLFVLFAALAAAMLGAGSAAAAAAVQRRSEMGLAQAIGATRTELLMQLSAEAVALGLAGGILGVPAGLFLQRWIGKVVFHTAPPVAWIVAPVGLALALFIALAASLMPLWSAIRVDPSQVLRGE